MKSLYNKIAVLLSALLMFGCADNSFEEYPLDNNFPLQLVLDAEEGAALPDAEDVEIEIKFADILPAQELPKTQIDLDYSIVDLEGNMIDHVEVDKIVYEVELDDCVYERELSFDAAADGLSGTIHIITDPDLGTVPESFEIVLSLPGDEDTEGEFKIEFSNLQSSTNLLLGNPNVFQFEVLDNDVAGEWELEITSAEEFESFKSIFGPINPDLAGLGFEEITGKIKAEFEFEEVNLVIELTETEEVTSCEDGETETELVNKEIEIEFEYEAEDGEIALEGSHPIINDDGLMETELDFIIEGEYDQDNDGEITYRFLSVVDEDNFSDGEELFRDNEGITFTFKQD